MIKVISNKNTSSNVFVSCRNIKYHDTPTFSGPNNIHLFDLNSATSYFVIKVDVGASDTEEINSLHVVLNLNCSNECSKEINVLKPNNPISSELFNTTNAISLYNAIHNSSTLIDRILFYKSGEVEIDITPLVKDSPSSRTFVFAITYNGDDSAVLDPSVPSFQSDHLFGYAIISEVYGFDSRRTYDNQSIVEGDSMLIDLYNGRAISNLDLFTTSGRHTPINISISYLNRSGFTHLDIFRYTNYAINYEYDICNQDDDIIIEDYIGNKRFYTKLDDDVIDSPTFEIEYGIDESNIPFGSIVFYCQEDRSYFFEKEKQIGSFTYYEIKLFDQDGNHIVLHRYQQKLFLVESINKNNQSITYEWDSIFNAKPKLDRISNSDLDEVLLSYEDYGAGGAMYLSSITFTKEKRRIDITQLPISSLTIYLYDTSDLNNDILIKKTVLSLTGSDITSIEEYNQNNSLIGKLEFSYSDHCVIQASKYNSNLTLIDYRLYSYEIDRTTLTNYRSEQQKLFFDRYGRLRTFIPKDYLFQSFNYEETYKDKIKIYSSKSQLLNISNNLLKNGNFSFYNSSDVLENWTSSGSNTYSLVGLSENGGRIVRLKSTYDNSNSISQTVSSLYPGKYIVRARIKKHSSSLPTIKATLTISIPNSNDTVTEYSLDTSSVEDGWEIITSEPITVPNIYCEASINISFTYASSIASNSVDIDYAEILRFNQSGNFNLLENGYFETVSNNIPTKWTFSNCTSSDKMEYYPVLSGYENVLQINSPSLVTIVKTIKQVVNIKGNKKNRYTLYSLFECDCTTSTIASFYLKFNYQNLGEKFYYFYPDYNSSSIQTLLRGVIAMDDFSSIEVGIEFNGVNPLKIFSIGLLNDNFEEDSYTENGIDKVLNSSDSRRIKISNYRYSNINGNGYHVIEDLNTNKNPTSIYDLKGKTISRSYNLSGDITSESISYGSESFTKTIDYGANNDITITDEYNEDSTFQLDEVNQVVEVTYPNSLYYEYEYDNKYNLISLSGTIRSSSTLTNSITYHTLFNSELSLTTPLGAVYQFNHDNYGRITSVSYHMDQLVSYTYENNMSSIDYDLLKSKQYGSSGATFSFDYDNNHSLTSVSSGNTLLYSYSYDIYSRLIKSSNNEYSYDTFYTYNEKNQVIKIKNNDSLIKYAYDNLGNIQTKSISTSQLNEAVAYDYEYDNSRNSREGFISDLSRIYGDEVFIAPMCGVGEWGGKFLSFNVDLSVNTSINSKVFRFDSKDKNIHYDISTFNNLRTPNNNLQNYNQEAWLDDLKTTKTFYMFFYPTGFFVKEYNLYAFAKKNGSSYSLIGYLSINKYGYIYYSEGGVTKGVSTSQINLSSWNSVFITFNGNSVSLYLNKNDPVTFNISNNGGDIIRFSLSYQSQYNWGVGDYASVSPTVTYDTFLHGVSTHEYSKQEIEDISNSFNHYYLHDNEPEKTNSSSYITSNSNFKIIYLDNNFVSTSGLEPINKMVANDTFSYARNRMFVYMPSLKRNVYRSFGGEGVPTLGYDFNQGIRGTFYMRFRLDGIYSMQERCVLNIYSREASSPFLRLFVSGTNLKIAGDVTTETIQNGLSLTDWHDLLITYTIMGFSIYLDGSLKKSITSFVRVYDEFYIGGYKDSNDESMSGYVELIAYSSSTNNSSASFIPKLVSETMDDFGRLTNKSIMVGDTNILSHQISYDKHRPISETYLNETWSYEYDSVGNVTKKESATETELFQYDNLSRITSHVFPDRRIETFTYDKNGNIIGHSLDGAFGSQLRYNYVDDRLVAITSFGTRPTTFTYDSDNLHITSVTQGDLTRTYNWTNNLLTGIDNRIEYRYNENGIRIYKSTPDETTTFVLEGSNIISMTKVIDNVTHHFYFHYDMHGNVISFTYNNNDYFYVRDMLGNITNIINESGASIVKYSYSAFGVPFVVSFTDTFIKNNNPFLFKGYFYDYETGLYYLKSRYYDPTIMRFISIDEASYLDSHDLRGVNLFAYCKNNPVMYADENGRFPILSFSLGLMLLAGIGLMISGRTSNNDTLTCIGDSIISGFEIISGALIISSGVGAKFGFALLITGFSSISSGLISEMSINSFHSGWTGAEINGILLFLIPKYGLVIGSLFSSVLSDLVASNYDFNKINPAKAIVSTFLACTFSTFGHLSNVFGSELGRAGQMILQYDDYLLSLVINIMNGFWPKGD